MNLEKKIKWYVIIVSIISGFFINNLVSNFGTEHLGLSLLTFVIIIMNLIFVNKKMNKLTKKD